MKKTALYIFAALFALLLLVPYAFMNREKNVVSELDNRTLTEAPVFGEAGYQGKLEQYFSDRIGGRSLMIRVYTKLHDVLFKEMVHPTYTYGKNGYVFFKMAPNVKYTSYHQHFAQAILQMQEYCEARGAKFYLLINPEKKSVYRRFLPDGVKYNDEWMDLFLAELDRLGVTYVSNVDYLQELSYTQQVFNRQYNAGHWNDLGCFYGMNHLFARMHKDFPAVRELTFDDFDITTRVQTSLQVSEFSIYEEEPVFTPHTTFTNLTSTIQGEVKTHPSYRGLHYFANNADNADQLPKLLIFQGSYLNGWAQYMFQNTSLEFGVHNYQNVFNLPYYFQLLDPDAVVFEIAEYVFTDDYFSESSMLSLDFPPALVRENEGQNIEAYVSSLPELNISLDSIMIPSNGLDTIRVRDSFGMKYAWLVLNDRVLDLTNAENGWFEALVIKNSVQEQSSAFLVIEDESGHRFRVPSNLRMAKELTDNDSLSFTDHVQNLSPETLTFDTDLDGNAFSYMTIQLYNTATQTYTTVVSSSEVGKMISSFYYHADDAGDFQIYLRANSNLEDQVASIPIHLDSGQYLFFSFKIDDFSDTHIEVSNFSVYY